MSRRASNPVFVRFIRPSSLRCYLRGITPLNRFVFGTKEEAQRFPSKAAAKKVICAGGYKPSAFSLVPVGGLQRGPHFPICEVLANDLGAARCACFAAAVYKSPYRHGGGYV